MAKVSKKVAEESLRAFLTALPTVMTPGAVLGMLDMAIGNLVEQYKEFPTDFKSDVSEEQLAMIDTFLKTARNYKPTKRTRKIKQNYKITTINRDFVVTADGTKEYRKNGVLHRKDGPAIIRLNGEFEWWVEGELEQKAHVKPGQLPYTIGRTMIAFDFALISPAKEARIKTPPHLEDYSIMDFYKSVLEGQIFKKNVLYRIADTPNMYVWWNYKNEIIPFLKKGHVVDEMNRRLKAYRQELERYARSQTKKREKLKTMIGAG